MADGQAKACAFTGTSDEAVEDIGQCRLWDSASGVFDRDKAELLRGRFIAVERENAVKLKKDNYFITDLKGLNVIDDERGDLGKVIDCFATGPQFTLEIKRENKKKNLMLPFVKVYCYEVDIEAGYIKCRLPEGLYELYD